MRQGPDVTVLEQPHLPKHIWFLFGALPERHQRKLLEQ